VESERENETAVGGADPLLGSIFDKRFRVESRIAAGGFGAIYRATHVKSGHPIALKVLHPTLASDLGVLARFRREGTTLTSLRNPHTITAYEFGQSDKTLFIVLELLHGDSLYEHYSSNGPLEWKRVVKIARQVCESLEEAHAQGIVHRDLKPTNIHLENVDGDPDFVKVLDFGIAKIVRGSDHDSGDITNVGQMIGTLDYMSPEQMVGGQVTGQTDFYTLGILMYEMIAGTRPFPESSTAGAALAAMLKTTPEPLYLRAPVPRPLDDIVMRCLERETTKRYRSVGQLREDLERVSIDGAPANTATVQVGKHLLDGDDDTSVTPPPDVRTAPRPKQIIEWDDDDEHAPTSTRRPDGSDDGRTPKPAPLRPSPRAMPGRFGESPPAAAAPLSSSPRVRAKSGQVPQTAESAALGMAQTALHLPPIAAQLIGNAPGVTGHPSPAPSQGVPLQATGSPASGRASTAKGPHGAGSPGSGTHGALPPAAPNAPHGSPPSGPHGNPFGHEPGSGRMQPPSAPYGGEASSGRMQPPSAPYGGEASSGRMMPTAAPYGGDPGSGRMLQPAAPYGGEPGSGRMRALPPAGAAPFPAEPGSDRMRPPMPSAAPYGGEPGPDRMRPPMPSAAPYGGEPGSSRMRPPTLPPGSSPFPAEPGSSHMRPPTMQPYGPPGAHGMPASLTTTSPGHAPARTMLPPTPNPLGAHLPPTPVPTFIPPTPPMAGQAPRLPTAQYDMGRMAASETVVRRIIWIVVLLVAAAVGFVLASQL
jgi:serine/threonine-protein kinase